MDKLRRVWIGKGSVLLKGLILVMIAVSCQKITPARLPHQMQPEPIPKTVLGPGDVLDVKFAYTPEFNESQTVRPDGKVELQFVGEVPVQGKSPEDLRDELIRLYTPHLKYPQLIVIVRSSYDRRIYVGGEVISPKLLEMPGPMTPLEAIIQAGGYNPLTAELGNVVIIRHKEGKRYGCALDLKKELAGEEVKAFYLEPHDIVYVPPTKVVQVTTWIDQHINKMMPQIGFNYLMPHNGGTIGIDTVN